MHNSFAGSNFAPAISNVPALAQRVANVIAAVDPDVVTIQEGAGMPEMRTFFNDLVGGATWHIVRGSGGAQALVIAVRLDRDVTAIAAGPTVAGGVDLTAPISADVDADLVVNQVPFARTPQVVTLTAHGQDFLLLNNHLKSKFVRNGEQMFNAGGEQRLAFFADALAARRRISAEAFRIRSYLDQVITADSAARVIVAGDLNDGPGADFFEENFLTHSVVDRVFGSIFNTATQLKHVLLHGGSQDFTAQFHDFITDTQRDLVLDHIGLSQEIDQNWNWTGRVAVAEYQAQQINDPNLHERDQNPSDHRPVVVAVTPNP
jgi:hypothetical protein